MRWRMTKEDIESGLQYQDFIAVQLLQKLGCEGCYYNKKENKPNVQSDNTNETTKP